jgi:tetratricopeptide (TPR) repeat protein
VTVLSTARNKIIGITGMVVVLVAVGFVVYNQARPTPEKTLEKRTDISTAITRAEKLRSQGKFDEAIVVMKDFVGSAAAAEQKVAAYVQIGNLYFAKGDFKESLAAYQEAEKLGGNTQFVVMSGAALAAERAGNKEVAIKYYEKAIPLIDPKAEGTADLKKSYEERLANLKKA